MKHYVRRSTFVIMIAFLAIFLLLEPGFNCFTTNTEQKSNEIKTVDAEELQCPIGYWRGEEETQCRACPEWTYGSGCTHKCNCIRGNSRYCDHVTGSCRCKYGWSGSTCSKKRKTHLGKRAVPAANLTGSAPESIIGDGGIVCIVNCGTVTGGPVDFCGACNSQNTASCDTNSLPFCKCKDGYRGDTCGSSCSDWKYGSSCGSDCACVQANSASCNNVNGACTCSAGYIGTNCENACSAWKYGDGCSSDCTCVQANTASCINENGQCLCNPGYSGITCDTACSEWKYGSGCVSDCTCIQANTATCSSIDGECACNSGYFGTNCESTCVPWKFGNDCGNDCTCVQANSETCNDMSGACTCKPGYIGTNCETACSGYTYGAGCTENCSCIQNNTLTCSHVNGSCACTTGYTGLICNETCPLWTYGAGCVSTCTCDRNNTATCSSNGTCVCKPGYSGTNCIEVCADNTFGISCIGICDCDAQNTNLCDKVSGACVCNSGWEGTRCDTAAAFALVSSPALVGTLGFLAALVLVVIIAVVLWCACRCSCHEVKSRSRRKKDFIELSEIPEAPEPPIGGGMPAKAAGYQKTPTAQGLPNDNDGVYYGRDALNNSFTPAGNGSQVAPPVPTSGDEYYYTDGVSAAAAGNAGKDLKPKGDVPATTYQNYSSNSATSSPRINPKVAKTPLPLPPVAQTKAQPVYGNAGIQEEYESLGGRGVSETYADLD